MNHLNHKHLTWLLSSFMSLLCTGCLDILDTPQPCYSTAQCPASMTCVASECVLSTVISSHDFNQLTYDDMEVKEMMMGGEDMALDMDVADPYPVTSPICHVNFDEMNQIVLEMVEVGNSVQVVNQHKFFCLEDVFGVLGYDFMSEGQTEENPSMIDPNELTVSVLENGQWKRHACNLNDFPKINGIGLHSARLLDVNEGGQRELELTYHPVDSTPYTRSFSWERCEEVTGLKLPDENPPGFSYLTDLTSIATGSSQAMATWVKAGGTVEGKGAISILKESRNFRCQHLVEGIESQWITDLWGMALGGNWFSWFTLMKKDPSFDETRRPLGELLLSIQDVFPEAVPFELRPCLTLATLRIGVWPLDYEQKQDWRSQIQLQVDPVRKEIFYCNYNENRVCRLNRWHVDSGSQWLLDSMGNIMSFNEGSTFQARANHIVVQTEVNQIHTYKQLQVYQPCHGMNTQEVGEISSPCFEADQTVIKKFSFPDYQILLFKDQTQSVQEADPYLVWIELESVGSSNRWVIKRKKL